MEESRRSGEKSGIVVKNRTSSGCLIVRKKSEGVSVAGSSGTRKAFESKKERKRPRLILSDSGSSDELLMPPRRRLGPETIRVCNGLSGLEKGAMEQNEFGRKRDRDRLEFTGNTEDGPIVRNEGLSDRKRNRLDVFEFDEYDGVDEEILRRSGVGIVGRRFLGSSVRSGIGRDYGTGSSRHAIMDKRKNMYFERTSSFNQGGMNRFGMDRDIARTPIPLLREKRLGDSEEPIRVQGKNGVLKVMVNKKKKVAESIRNNNHLDAEVNRSSSKFERTVRKTVKSSVPTPSCLETEVHAKSGSFARAERNTEVLERRGSSVRKEKNQIRLQKSQTTKNIKGDDSDSDESDTALKLGPKGKESLKAVKEDSSGSEKTPGRKLTLSRIKEGKVKRGSGTEKQKLREKIRGMLIDAGWTIDYRPRRNRDYLDAVYINPSGTAYWSIIKAYDALLKQLNEEEVEAKPIADGSFSPLPDEVLGQLTRKTKKKMEKEMKRKQRDSYQGANARETSTRKSLSTRHDDESMGSISHEDKLSSYMKGGKSSKIRMSENCLHDGNGKLSSASTSHLPHGRKSRKLGRCTLLVRNSSKGPNSETDGFTPYAGKRTLLSWLIDLGNIQLSEKVQYMNRRRTKVMLEGWVTRDGIHCGCCSKILTVSKFEIHAASKLRQPFQHICLESGVSLLQCQMDAWKKLVETENIGFNSVHVDGDDPNDDTCGICGDGGDLICCDGCPSTFHQSCLDIQMLPPGDWHCPNCTCKFCGVAGENVAQGDSTTACSLLTCSMCDKKYHELCIQDMDACSLDANGSVPFCGQKCRELFEHLQKNLGVKHELESGYTWSLIRRTDEDPDSVLRGSPQRVECNSKLAVALTVMDECFLPIVDRRSGVNLIRNVLYNSGSNFNRLNYGGFYTAVLERGDEIISAASLRFHGTQLAEMPFIGTRHIYRRQGMCRRLFCALESALCSFKVEKLVIPAISELMHTWTSVFGFTPLEESVKRELRSLNMLVFPGVDMLQKQLLEKENTNDDLTPGSGSKLMESNAKHGIKIEVENKPGMSLSAEHNDVNFCADDARNGETAAGDVDPNADVSSDDTSTHTGSPDPTGVDSESGDKLAVSTSDVKSLSNSEEGNDASEMENKTESGILAEDVSTRSIKEGENDNALMMDVDTAASHVEEIAIPKEELVESVSERKSLTIANTSDGDPEIRDKTEADLPVEDNTVADNADTSHKFKTPDPVEETAAESAADMKCPTPGTSNGETKIEDKLVLFSSSEDDTQSCKDSGVLPSAISSHSKSGDKLVKIEPPVENKPVYCSSIEDNAQSSKEVDMDDAHAEDLGAVATNEVQTLEAACHKKSPLASGIINNSPEKQNGLLSTNPIEDISQSCKVGDVGAASAGQPPMKHQQTLDPDYDKTQSFEESVMNGDFTTTGEKEKFSDMSSSLPATFETDSEERHCGSEILDGKDKS